MIGYKIMKEFKLQLHVEKLSVGSKSLIVNTLIEAVGIYYLDNLRSSKCRVLVVHCSVCDIDMDASQRDYRKLVEMDCFGRTL